LRIGQLRGGLECRLAYLADRFIERFRGHIRSFSDGISEALNIYCPIGSDFIDFFRSLAASAAVKTV
jgi:hypothetical protein